MNRIPLASTLQIMVCLLTMCLLNQCSPGPGVVSSPPSAEPNYVGSGLGAQTEGLTAKRNFQDKSARVKKSRPGLGTGWGDEVKSSMSWSGFVREGKKPAGLASIYYNDKEGVKAMTRGYYWKGKKMKRSANNLVEWGVKGRLGYYDSLSSNGKRFVVGSQGRQYSLEVKNICDCRIEVVLSVDGLDVMDGKPASLRKRGYIIAPGKTLSVKGFRTSRDAVAAFKFSSVGASYTNMRHGETRNVGVMGLAVYTEKGMDPWRWSKSELNTRQNARAFAEAPVIQGR